MQAPAPTFRLQDVLALAEERSRRLSDALLAGEPDQVAVNASELQQVMQALGGLLELAHVRAGLDAGTTVRLRRVGQALTRQREACLRRSAVVDRALQSIIPGARTTTYGGGATPYGQQARRSGAFKLIAA